MASSRGYLDYILEQLSELEDLAWRGMMGEFILYYHGKVFGGIYDDRFLVKPTLAAEARLPGAARELPYEGAREMLLVDRVDDRAFLRELVEAMDAELPAPKRRNRAKPAPPPQTDQSDKEEPPMLQVYCYSRCTTCKKALAWLDAHGLAHTDLDIKTEHPDEETLRRYHARSGLPLKRFFNTSGIPYRELGLSKKLPELSEDEQFRLLASDGMLVKRPLVVGEDFVLTGFKEAEWTEKLLP